MQSLCVARAVDQGEQLDERRRLSMAYDVVCDFGLSRLKASTFLSSKSAAGNAFGKSLKTWKSWVLEKLDPDKTYVFFRSRSPVHYRNGTWNLESLGKIVILLGSERGLPLLMLLKTAATGAYQACLTHGMRFSMWNSCQ
ncbi:hypothetical protein Bca52824_002431 [Brassica carinata]|uniref:Trichome birefringence-like C-terminal domain-containing protein n=1 Tax=Brassica carinata TaxID=52824 RepID=A0A8X7WKN7_BRACI|nr:hypothetical protein Bca52824_002431 [Brassica carinata]